MFLRKLSLAAVTAALSLSTAVMAQQTPATQMQAPTASQVLSQSIAELLPMAKLPFGDFPVPADQLNEAANFLTTQAQLNGVTLTRDQALVALGYIAGQREGAQTTEVAPVAQAQGTMTPTAQTQTAEAAQTNTPEAQTQVVADTTSAASEQTQNPAAQPADSSVVAVAEQTASDQVQAPEGAPTSVSAQAAAQTTIQTPAGTQQVAAAPSAEAAAPQINASADGTQAQPASELPSGIAALNLPDGTVIVPLDGNRWLISYPVDITEAVAQQTSYQPLP